MLELQNNIVYLMASNEEYLVTGVRKLKADMFESGQYRDAFMAMVKHYRNGGKVSVGWVEQRIPSLVESDYTDAAYFEGLLNTLITEYRKRQINKFAAQAKASGVIDNNALDVIAGNITELRGDCELEFVGGKDLSFAAYDSIMGYLTNETPRVYVGIERLKDYCYSFEAGEMITLSANTGVGKSAFAMNLAVDFARQETPVLYINTEMNSAQMFMRWVSLLAADDWVNINNLLRGYIGPTQNKQTYQAMIDAIAELGKLPIREATIKFLTVEILRDAMTKAAREGVKVVFVDYLGRVDKRKAGKMNMWDYFQMVAAELKTLAQLYGITVFIVSQVSKDGSLAGASYIEHEADSHIRIERRSEKDKDKFDEYWNYVIDVRKNRMGKIGKVPVCFIGEKVKFCFDGKIAYQRWQNEQRNSGN